MPDKAWKPVYDLLRPVRMRVTWAVSLPRLFSATHSYLPASLISMLCMNRSPEDNTVARGSVSAAIPNVLYHVIWGSGTPSARHVKVTFPPNVTCFSEGGLVIVGGTTNWNKTRVTNRQGTVCFGPRGGYPQRLSWFPYHKAIGVFLLPPGWDASPSQEYLLH